jgi:hypothetical protein
MAEAFNKIGFHVGPGGNMTGIGEWMRQLDAARIPFCLKTADNYGPVHEAVGYMRASGVPHVLVFRLTTQEGVYDFDVPDYELTPAAAAAVHWQRTLGKLPPEFDKERVWLEPINEVDKARSDWLGYFAFEISQLALRDGYKVALFGWSSGEPEPADWETEGMLCFLRLCAGRPGRKPAQVAVSLHEYSYKDEDIWFLRDLHVGRFAQLFAACDRFQIKRPPVLITEWGWTYNSVPDSAKAMRDIEEVAALYARYPEILGAAIWYLGDGYAQIANKAQHLIQPLTEFTLQRRFPAPQQEVGPVPTPRPTPAPDEVPDNRAQPRPAPEPILAAESVRMSNGRFVKDVTIPDDTPIAVNKNFVKTWRVQNNGDLPWRAGYQIVHVGGTPMIDPLSHTLPAAAPGQQVDISLSMTAPATPGIHFSDWRFQDDQGNFFGDIFYVRIKATPVAPATGVSNSRFIADVTIADDTEVKPGKAFTKTWRVKNTGTRLWNSHFRLEFVRGDPMTSSRSQSIPAAAPGQEVDISVLMTAPTAPGKYFGDWRLQDDQGRFFGELIHIKIVVPEPQRHSPIKPLSQRDPAWGNGRLGNANSSQTIGVWGCLLTSFAMLANTYGKNVTPPQLNQLIVNGPGFINNNWTPWNALARLYPDIIFDGRLETRFHADVLNRINGALQAGTAVVLQVDNTPNTPYIDQDQHWVVVVGRDGDDYRVNDPLTGQEVSLRGTYGRAGQSLTNAIIAVVFYRSTTTRINYEQPVAPAPTPTDDQPPPLTRLQTGMNVNPDAPHSNPYQDDTFKGLDWARFVFKAAARHRDIAAGFVQYDPIIRAYADQGVSSLIILNQETVWANAPWSDNQDWQSYANSLADAAGKIGSHYAALGDRVAYQIWNEGDLPNNPASVFVPPDRFALLLRAVTTALRAAAPRSKIIFGGMATGPDHTIDYWRRCQAALGGTLLVDALAVHPYGRWATKAPFDWGSHFPPLRDAFDRYKAAFPTMPIWITEMGVADDNPIGPQYYQTIGEYIRDVYKYVGERDARQVPVLIWFAWSDLMRNAGIVDSQGNRKPHVYDAFRAVRNREL